VGYRHLMNAESLGVPRLSVFTTGTGVSRVRIQDGVKVETDFARALASGVKAAVIANPTSLHVQSALEAARAGCHLLIEKPLSHSLDDIEELISEVRHRSLAAIVGYQFRFHPGLQRVRAWLREEAIGEVVSAHARWGEYLPTWQPWRDYRSSYSARADLGGGALLTLSHPIDYLCWLLGDVAHVSATTSLRSGLGLDVEDTALVHLDFKSGAVAAVSLDYVQWPPDHSLTIVGRKGIICWDSADGIARLRAAQRARWETADIPEEFERNDMFIDEMDHFFTRIANPGDIGDSDAVACALEEGARVVQICLAAKESAVSGRRVDV
jgi:predicted dehydrogenase